MTARPPGWFANIYDVELAAGDQFLSLLGRDCVDHVSTIIDTWPSGKAPPEIQSPRVGRPACKRSRALHNASMSSGVLYGASEARTVLSRPKRRRIGWAHWWPERTEHNLACRRSIDKATHLVPRRLVRVRGPRRQCVRRAVDVRVLVLVEVGETVDHRLWFLGRRGVVE